MMFSPVTLLMRQTTLVDLSHYGRQKIVSIRHPGVTDHDGLEQFSGVNMPCRLQTGGTSILMDLEMAQLILEIRLLIPTRWLFSSSTEIATWMAIATVQKRRWALIQKTLPHFQ